MKENISKNELIERLRSNEKLSSIFPSLLIFAKVIKDSDLEKWTLLEMNGYYNTNPAAKDKTNVPEYRKVFGQYHDIYNRPLIISDPKISFINEYKLNNPIVELEEMSKSNGLMSIKDPIRMKLVNEGLKVDVFSFDFSAKSCLGIIESIRTTAIEKILIIKSVRTRTKYSKNIDTNEVLLSMHPEVIRLTSKLIKDGHFRQAVLDTYIHLIDCVKTKSGCRELDGVSLIQTVFSVKTPIIRYSKDLDEQLGIMWLFSGAVMAIRNVRAHKIKEQDTQVETLEWLNFASALFRILDKSEVIKENNKKSNS
jgi:uncharacterized protein (TIGR02391 family)